MAPMKKRLIRIPPEMDAELVRRAEEQGTSVSDLIRLLLAGGLRFKLPKK
jgi:predicted HicB family RNase H-like nuclease